MSDDIAKGIGAEYWKASLNMPTEIERLRAENEKLRAENKTHKEIAVRETMNVATLRAALKDLIEDHEYMTDTDAEEDNMARAAARAALKETGDE